VKQAEDIGRWEGQDLEQDQDEIRTVNAQAMQYCLNSPSDKSYQGFCPDPGGGCRDTVMLVFSARSLQANPMPPGKRETLASVGLMWCREVVETSTPKSISDTRLPSNLRQE
jgi:hypothetical protein